MSRISKFALSALGTIFLFGCGGGDAPGGTGSAPPTGGDVVAEVPTPAPSATPTPAPSAGSIVGTNMEAGYPQLDKIATNFTVADQLIPTGGTGVLPGEEPGGADAPGAFRFLCKPSHLAYDDPVVFPGQKGRSHLHLFFGNTAADGNSTYESLRTTGASTCNNMLNRSAYWIPALLNGRGQAVMPEYVSIYYKRLPPTHPECQQGKGCIGIPRGLRYVFGRTMTGGDLVNTYFNCTGPGAVEGHYETLADAAKNCPTGALIGAVAIAPDCWNGKELDSPDHRSHMSYRQQDGYGHARCPSTHPYQIPGFMLGAWFPTDDTLDRSGDKSPDAKTWYFSSDRMAGMPHQPSGTTFHADWFGAWDDTTLSAWIANCIDKKRSCTGGDLGNGTEMRYSPEFTAVGPRLVDIPPDPKG